jgi:hypothetical protein
MGAAFLDESGREAEILAQFDEAPVVKTPQHMPLAEPIPASSR